MTKPVWLEGPSPRGQEPGESQRLLLPLLERQQLDLAVGLTPGTQTREPEGQQTRQTPPEAEVQQTEARLHPKGPSGKGDTLRPPTPQHRMLFLTRCKQIN